MKTRPEFTVIAGPNGAGKSRLCPYYIHCKLKNSNIINYIKSRKLQHIEIYGNLKVETTKETVIEWYTFRLLSTFKERLFKYVR